MPHHAQAVSRHLLLSLAALALGAVPAPAQCGPLFTGAGAVNRSMGGAAVATALDATGALYWNPATMSGLERSELAFSVELLFPREDVASSIAAGALGPAGPPVGLAGSSRSDLSVYPLPSAGWVVKSEGSPWAFGLGVFEGAGLGVNYPASSSNPILTPQAPRGLGLGAIFSELQVLEIAPALSYQVTDWLAVGAGPIVALAGLRVDPAVVAPPDDANGDHFATYPNGTHTKLAWGGGFQAGVYCTLDGGWRLGVSAQSPRWFERFRFQSTDEVGRPRSFDFAASLPLVVSVGGAYAGFEHWLLAADVRYIDFRNAEGLGDRGFDPSGALRGVGWDSIVALALGAQYRLSDAVSLRAGYSFSQNPVPERLAFVNVASPSIAEHVVYLGASYDVTASLSLAVSYAHAFQNSVTGPFITPGGPIPGTSVTSSVSADTFLFGATVRFGGPEG